MLLLCAMCSTGQSRRVSFDSLVVGDFRPVPKFEKGYVLLAEHRCMLSVFEPNGRKLFTRELQAPGGLPCQVNEAAVDAGGAFAAAISFSGPFGFTGAILFLDATGKTVSFIDTERYLPAHIGFDRNRSLWSIGTKRDEVNTGMTAKDEYFLVRKFSRDGKLLGEFIPRSWWSPRGAPGDGGRGYWHLAVARDRVAAIIHENFSEQTPELIEWDLDGKLLARTPIAGVNCGRAYTESGKLYGRNYDRDRKIFEMFVLDTDTKQWKPTGEQQYMGEAGFLLGAQGDELVYRATSSSDLVWLRP